MYQSRDETRQVFFTVWQKLQQGLILETMESIIADVIQLHPEYHDLLENDNAAQQSEFNANSGTGNPFLHMGMHIALREQASSNRPYGIQPIHARLCQKMNIHEAEHLMMECLGRSLWEAQRQNCAPDEASYLDCLHKI